MSGRVEAAFCAAAWVALASLKTGDVVSTYFILKMGGAEASSFPRSLFGALGVGWGLLADYALAMGMALAACVALRTMASRGALPPRTATALWLVFMAVFCAASATAVAHNLAVAGS